MKKIAEAEQTAWSQIRQEAKAEQHQRLSIEIIPDEWPLATKLRKEAIEILNSASSSRERSLIAKNLPKYSEPQARLSAYFRTKLHPLNRYTEKVVQHGIIPKVAAILLTTSTEVNHEHYSLAIAKKLETIMQNLQINEDEFRNIREPFVEEKKKDTDRCLSR